MMAIETVEGDPFLPLSTPSKRHSSSFPTADVEERDSNGNGIPHRKSSSSASSSSFQLPASMQSSPTKSSTVLPLQTPPPVKPNAHPYAIKTTAAGILSRSSSNAASPHYNESHRYVPPPSPLTRRSSVTDNGPPSPTKGSHHYQGSSGGGGGDGGLTRRRSNAYRGHRYSQSLTDVSGAPVPAHGPPPRPLPVPPEFMAGSDSRSGSVSPTKSSRFMELQAEFEDGIPNQNGKATRAKRPETLPADFMPPSSPFIFPPPQRVEEPANEDPKSWTPDQVATYLRDTVNSEELANLVLQKQIAGRAFLRIASLGSDERDDIDQALRAASRTLRQSSLRGRIWGLDGTSNDHYRPRSDSESSASSIDGFSPNASRGTSRVRGMVQSFERTANISEDDGTRSRSVSPTKPTFVFPPPQKLRAQDLFGFGQEPVASPEDEIHATVKGHGQQVKELPRLLPLPPTFTGGSTGLLSPMSTGSTTTMAPTLTGGSELGYLRPSPSISPALQRSERATSRLLPLPPTGPVPIVQQPSPPLSANVLHHPMPRRNVGGEGVGVVSSLDERAGEEEFTMEELLSQGADSAEPVSGAKAWEMEVGTTVKKAPGRSPGKSPAGPRIIEPAGTSVVGNGAPPTPAQPNPEAESAGGTEGLSPTPPKTDLSFVNSGRRTRGVRPRARPSIEADDKKNGSASEGEGSSLAPPQSKASWRSGRRTKRDSKGLGSSVLSLFDPPSPASVEDSSLKEKGQAVNDREASLDKREKDIAERERVVGEREVAVGKREDVLTALGQDVGAREADLRVGQQSVKEHDQSIAAREAELEKREAALRQRDISLQAREEAIITLEQGLKPRSDQLEAREKAVEEVEARLRLRAMELEKREQDIKSRETVPLTAVLACPSTQEVGERPREDEDTFALATRLFRRVVAPVFGEGLTEYLLGPLDVPADASNGEADTQDDQGRAQARSRKARRGLTWLTSNRGANYLMLLGVGVCAIVLRVLLKRALPGVGLGRPGVRGLGMR